MGNLADLTVSLGLDVTNYSSGIEQAQSKAMSFGGIMETAIGSTLANVAAEGATAIAGLAASSVTAAADFEAGMLSFGSVTGSAVADAGLSLDQFQDKFLELGATTAFSAAQAQEAAIALAKGGVPIPAIMEEATAATLDLASAGGLELAAAADIVAKQLGVWAETGTDAAQVADLMAQAANASTVDVDELAMGLANVNGVAKTAGVEFDDLVQTMALIAPGFGSASDAGTSLKTFLSRLIPTTDSATQAMAELGLYSTDYIAVAQDLGAVTADFAGTQEEAAAAAVKMLESQTGLTAGTKEFGDAWQEVIGDFSSSAFYDAQGSFVGMEEASRLLQEATKDLSEEERLLAFNTIFGSDAVRAAAAIANAGGEGFNAMGDAMAGAGTAAEQAAAKNQGFKFALDSLFGSVETLQIIVGGALLPMLTALVNEALIPAVNWFTTLSTALLNGGINSQAFLDALGPFAGVWKAILDNGAPVLSFLQDNLGPIMAGLGSMVLYVVVPAFVSWAIAAGTAAAATIAAMLPVVLPIAAVGLAVGLLKAAWDNNWGGIQEKTGAVVSFLQGQWENLKRGFDFVVAGAAQLKDNVTNGFNTAKENITNAITVTKEFLETTWQAIYDNTIGKVTEMWTNAVGRFTAAHPETVAQLNKIKEDATAIWNFIKEQTIGKVTELWTTVTGKFTSSATEAGTTLTTFGATVSSKWEEIKSKVTEAVGAVYDKIKEKFDSAKEKALEAIGGIASGIAGKVGEFASAAADIGSAIIDGAVGAIERGASSIISSLVSLAGDALGALKEKLGISSPSEETDYMFSMVIAGGLRALDREGHKLIEAGVGIGEDFNAAMDPHMSPSVSLSGSGSSNSSGATFYIDARGAFMTEEEYEIISRRVFAELIGEAYALDLAG